MKSYDNKKSSEYITYLNVNDLYGWTLSLYGYPLAPEKT